MSTARLHALTSGAAQQAATPTDNWRPCGRGHGRACCGEGEFGSDLLVEVVAVDVVDTFRFDAKAKRGIALGGEVLLLGEPAMIRPFGPVQSEGVIRTTVPRLVGNNYGTPSQSQGPRPGVG